MPQQTSLEELAQLTLQAFCNQKTRAINQMLHRLMGEKRLLRLGGEIIGVAVVSRRQRRYV